MVNGKDIGVKVVKTGVQVTSIVVRSTVRKLMRRRTLAYVGGVFVMYGAVIMISKRPEWVDHELWDMTAFVIHGIGAIPFIKPFEAVVETGVD